MTPPIHIVEEDDEESDSTTTPPPTMTHSSPVSPPSYLAPDGDGNHLDLGRTGLESKYLEFD